MSILEILGVTISTSTLNNPSVWLSESLGGRRTASGEHVGPERALALSAYFAALRAISEDVAKVPLQVFQTLQPAGRELVKDHPATRLLFRQPNPDMSAMSFREVMQSYALGHGDGFAEIVRDGSGVPTELWPLHPSDVRIDRGEDGALVFTVRRRGGDPVRLRSENIFHIHGLGPDGLHGYSIARLGAESLGLSMALQNFGASFFGNSLRPSGILEHPGKYDVNQENTLRESFEKGHTGSASKASRLMILWAGMKWIRETIPPNEAQFIESRQFQIEEIARWFRMPPSKLHHLLKANFNTLEMQNMEYFQDTLDPWFTRWEQEADRKLLTQAEVASGLLIDHDMRKINRTDVKTRSEHQRTLFNIGALSPNEIREQENMNPVEGGDERYIPMNLINIKQAAQLGNSDPGAEDRSQALAVQAEERIKAYRHHTAKAVQSILERFARKEIKICESQGARFKGFSGNHTDDITTDLSLPIGAMFNYFNVARNRVEKRPPTLPPTIIPEVTRMFIGKFTVWHICQSVKQFKAAVESDTIIETLEHWQHERPAAEALKLVSDCERLIHETQEQER